MVKNALAVLMERNCIEWCSNPEELASLFSSEMVTGYIGFDPTADSLHVGHLIPIMGLAWMQRLGHRPIAIAGGGTGLIGDPSGKSKERNLLTLEQVEQNMVTVKKQLEHFLDFDCGANSALIINNYDWLGKLGLIEFLRDTGKHFTVNYMIGREYVRSRLEDPEKSISFTEFSYMLLQAYDFYHLYKEYGCRLQMGGNDQQGNIIAGIDLIRKRTGGQAYGITYPLLLTATGQKFGKTEGGAVWLSPEKTSPYKFYQFWINTDDRDVEKLLRLFTFMPLDEIKGIMEEHERSPEKRTAQKRLAWEVTKVVHGETAAASVKRASEILFGGRFDLSELDKNMLSVLRREVPSGCFSMDKSSNIVDLLVESGACKSKGEAKRLIKGGGLVINGRKVISEDETISENDLLQGKYVFLRLGKKRYHIAESQ
ncbi:tyrosine--tRNA ligase [Thermovirga sp.]|uniref:tyrosine--tRNA ligase n=1 Tax=Thermovirga sp. TaxID=2699834 RepID=UPI0025F513FA|nr:tyrosine--tRNA ligase [Thermovirga sp.]MBO8153739.1 tyrosine--tRNA ligase [Thermovirga sp.]